MEFDERVREGGGLYLREIYTPVPGIMPGPKDMLAPISSDAADGSLISVSVIYEEIVRGCVLFLGLTRSEWRKKLRH